MSIENIQDHLPNVGRQYFAAIVANLVMLGHGTVIGWVPPVTLLLLSNDTPLETGPLTSEQLSWIGSLTSFGGLLGPIIFGYITSRIGCKRTLFLLTMPTMLFWIIVFHTNTYEWLVVGLLIAGLTGSSLLTSIVLFVSDIANDSIRGRLGSFLYLARNIGILFGFVIGSIVEYHYLPCVFIIVQITFNIIAMLLPNTPQFHLQREQYEKAEKSLKFYKGFKGNTIDETNAFNIEFERLKAIAKQNTNDGGTIRLADFGEREALFGLIIALLLASLSQLVGSFTFITYAVLIFKETGSTIDPYISSITIAVMQIFGNLLSAQFVDSIGRKLLIIISLVGNVIGLFVLASYTYLHQAGYDLSSYSWVPIVSLSFEIFITSAGIVSLASICAIEFLPSKLRTVGTVICAIWTNAMAFGCNKSFPILLGIINLHGCFLIFIGFSIFGIIYVLFCVKETKGQPLDVLKTEKS